MNLFKIFSTNKLYKCDNKWSDTLTKNPFMLVIEWQVMLEKN